jgi:CheY-like chemotaxis protein
MPGHNGFEVAKAMTLSVPNPPPIVLLTSSGLPGEIEECRRAGIKAYLLKPCTRREIESALRQVLSPEEDTSSSPMPLVTRASLQGASHAPVHVLLAEDNAVNELLTVTLLRRWGHEVTVAINGEQAVALHAQHRFDAVLMDVHMPGMSGLEATRRMRDEEHRTGRPRTPVIALTASAMEADRRACMDAGMDDYLSKPLRASTMWHTLDRHINQARAESDRSVAYRQALAQADTQTVEIIAGPFLSELPGELRALTESLAALDLPTLARRAHSMKGLLLAFAAEPAAGLAAQLQHIAENMFFDPERAQKCLAELEREMALLSPHLREVAIRVERQGRTA